MGSSMLGTIIQMVLPTSLYPPVAPSSSSSNEPVLNGLTRSMLRHGYKDIQISFQAETSEGQQLKVHIWQQDDEGPAVMRASVEFRGYSCCQMRIEFYKEHVE